ncbi:MAG: sugar phosphate isomerase/epimerase [Anaerolineae bacterium]|nr:sugar phosphate isomerase/epimerase [Anaerolineae bacterium]
MIPSIWTGMYAEVSLLEALCHLQTCGWMAFEVSTEHLSQLEQDSDCEAHIAEVRHYGVEHNLILPQAHAFLSADVAAPDKEQREQDVQHLLRHIEISYQLGVKNVVIHPGGRQMFTTRAERMRIMNCNVETFRYLGDFAGKRGIHIGLENLMRRGACTPPEILELLAAIDHPAIGITLDTSHARVAKLDLPAVVREFGPYLIATHISDNDGSGDQHLTPGGGDIDWLAVMAAFKEIPYQGTFNFEIPGERHPDLALRAIKTRFALEVAEWLLTL